jgi:hypothetical protein
MGEGTVSAAYTGITALSTPIPIPGQLVDIMYCRKALNMCAQSRDIPRSKRKPRSMPQLIEKA